MNRAAALVLGLTLAVGAACPSKAETPVQGYEVVRAYPHDPEAFTQGLIWRDGHLVETTGRQPSVLRRVRLEDGEPVGLGSHDQLLANCPTYVEIVQSQLTAEEAAA